MPTLLAAPFTLYVWRLAGKNLGDEIGDSVAIQLFGCAVFGVHDGNLEMPLDSGRDLRLPTNGSSTYSTSLVPPACGSRDREPSRILG
ncbi:unnamed protein product, partial [Citrullus colocynthis]